MDKIIYPYMKYFSTRARFLAIIFLGTLFASCSLIDKSDKIIGPQWEPEFAVPILNTEFSMADLLSRLDSNSYIQTQNDGLLSLVYEDQLASVTGTSLLSLPNLPVPMFDTTQRVGFPVEGIKMLGIKQGLLNYSFESVDVGNHELVVQIPEASQNGQAYEQVVAFSAPGTFAGTLDLSGYDLDLSTERMTFKYFARPTGGSERKPLLNFFFEITDLDYDQINGYLGTQDLELGGDSIQMDVFEDLIDGEFRINDPRISITLDNTYGVPIEVQARKFEVQTSEGLIALDHTGLENGLPINFPELSAIGSSARTIIEINKDNSNIADLLSSKPSGISYDLSATLHPEGDTSNVGFVLDNSGFDLGLRVEVPLDIQLSDIELEQDLGLELTSMDQVESAELILITENGFPLELVLQAYFLDEQGTVQDSLFDGPAQLLSAASVDQNGRVIESSSSTLDIALTAERWYRLQNSAEIRIKAEIATTNAGSVPVKFYDDYNLKVKLGALAELNP